MSSPSTTPTWLLSLDRGAVTWLLSGRADRVVPRLRLTYCGPDIRRHERAVVYERELGHGLVAVFDFVGDAFEFPVEYGPDEGRVRWIAWGVAESLEPSLSRTRLIEDPALEGLFTRPPACVRLAPDVAGAIEARLTMPPFRAHTLTPPSGAASLVLP